VTYEGKNCEASIQLLLGNSSANMLGARQQLRNMQQWSKLEAMFSMRAVLIVTNATILEMLVELCSMRSLRKGT
jgi:hypothetical protein